MVAGTHGKTTTSALLAWVLHDRRPRPFVRDRRHPHRTSTATTAWAGGRDIVIEGDEYDTAFFDKGPKFLHYRPGGHGADQHRVRPRRHLPRPRARQERLPPAGGRAGREQPAAWPATGMPPSTR
ncbi:MAG: hypothetical protein MZV70_18905 [Desulfobacterales bacterium]|nr:hypothetical protein [Desulfobacterales bacterium]